MTRICLLAATILAVSIAAVLAAPGTLAAAPPASRPARPVAQTAPAPQKAPAAFTLANSLMILGQARWDDITIDSDAKQLYVTHPWQTQVIDQTTGKVIAEIVTPREGGSGDEHHVALVPKAKRGFITSRVTGKVTIFDLKTHAVLGSIAVGDEPTAIVYDPKSNRVLVCCAAGRTLVPFPPDIDPNAGKPETPLLFDGVPMGLVVDGQGMAYVGIVGKAEVAVIDTRLMAVAARWPLSPSMVPRDLALDRLRSRLFVGCGSVLEVLSATDGHPLALLVVGTSQGYVDLGGMDFFDGKAFASCGEGTMAVIGQTLEGRFQILENVPTSRGSKVLRVDRTTGTIYMPAYLAPNEISPPDGKTPPDGRFKIMVLQKK